MPPKKGVKRGPYKKYDENGVLITHRNKKIRRSYLNCNGINKDGSLCGSLMYRYGYCFTHQYLLPILKREPVYVCEICKKDIDSRKKKSPMKFICSDCSVVMGQKCLRCDRGTFDFVSGLCTAHLSENICCEGTCKLRAYYGNVPFRYCSRHNPDKICTHVDHNVLCGHKTRDGFDYCKKHGGRSYDSSKQKTTLHGTCKKNLGDVPCRRPTRMIRVVDEFRVPDMTKCEVHGGLPVCYNCDKTACIGFEGMCEDHGGRTCQQCNGPIILGHKDSTICQECKYKNKKNAKRRCVETTIE